MLMVVWTVVNGANASGRTEPIIVDHTCTSILRIPEESLLAAKRTLHIVYGHTSHGSQVVDGMTGLVAFANGGGKGLALPQNCFAWNRGGVGGALDVDDAPWTIDVGYYPDWVERTRAYLNAPQNVKVNVVMWSWCGQVSSKYANGRLLAEYLEPMQQLEREYAHVTFVYMTGHVDHWSDANNKAANQVIRDYCEANNKVLYDFADIESHDPNGTYYPFPSDNCDYYASPTGAWLGNWAKEWQERHVLNVDWYACGSAHSEPLNANQKAYAAWWLFARVAGWPGTVRTGDDVRDPTAMAK